MVLRFRWIRRIAGLVVGLVPALALAAAPVTLCPGQIGDPAEDGRVLGHIPYVEAPASDLAQAPPGFGVGQPCHVQRDMLPDLTQLLDAAAATPGVGRALHGVSCFRSIPHQRAVFCSQIGPHRACKDAAERARTVAPPGFSEHGTGYAIDFAVRPAGRCADVQPCIADTAAGQWLLAHAPDYGFELSFPRDNAQGVTWEPWHWRWVGTTITEQGAARARLTVAYGRGRFPANPAVPERVEPMAPLFTLPPPNPFVTF